MRTARDNFEDRIDFHSHRMDDNNDLHDSDSGCEFQDFDDQTLHGIQNNINNSYYEKNVDTQKTLTSGLSITSPTERKPTDHSTKFDKQLTN